MISVWVGQQRRNDVRDYCRRYFDKRGVTFQYVDGEGVPNDGGVLVAVGGVALSKLQGAGLLPKNRGLGSLRGAPHYLSTGQTLIVTYDPRIMERDYARTADVMWDLQLAARISQTGSADPQLGDYQYVGDFSEVVGELRERARTTGKPQPVAIDLETVGLDPFNPDAWIVSIAITPQDGMSRVIRFRGPDRRPPVPPAPISPRPITTPTDLISNEFSEFSGDFFDPGYTLLPADSQNPPKTSQNRSQRIRISSNLVNKCAITAPQQNPNSDQNLTNRPQPVEAKYVDGAVVGWTVLDPALLEQLRWLASATDCIKVRGANFKFDQLWMAEKWGIDCWPTFVMDTTLVGSLLDENRSNSLNLHAKLFTPLGGYDEKLNKAYDKSRMDLVPDEPLLVYAGGDTDATYRTADVFGRALVRDTQLCRFYQRLLQPAAQAVAVMERRGIVVDREQYGRVEQEVLTAKQIAEDAALALIPGRLRAKYADNLALSRPALIQDFMFSPLGLNLKPKMFSEKKGSPSVALKHLEQFSNHEDAAQFIAAMRDWKQADKTHSTYVTGFLSHLRADGRFHPSYMLHRGSYGDKDEESGTVTGRTSAKDPAYQTLPKHTRWAKLLRTVYVPPPGYVILKADYSQGELRVVACVANETAMIAAYRRGIDLHLKTGSEVFGLPLDKAIAMAKEKDPKVKRIRQGGKAGNFGLIYGMQPPGFVSYADGTFGVELTLTQAEQFSDRFFTVYPRLSRWHEDSKEFAHRHGYVRSPLGRIRHLPLVNSRDNEIRSQQERQAINSPIQATLSDLGLLAIAELNARYPELWVFGFTHDDLGFYVPEDEVDSWIPKIAEVMENLPLRELGWEPQLRFPVDMDMGVKNLAELVNVRAS